MAPLRGALEGGSDPLRAERIGRLKRSGVSLVPDCSFGSARFLDLVGAERFDLLCHHAAEVGDYRSPDFDIAKAVAANTASLRQVLTAMGTCGAKGVVLTGSFFEAGEGAGSGP